MRSIFLGLAIIQAFAMTAQAGTKEAIDEIEATVHGTTAREIKDETLDMRIINIGADYDFMAMVSCQLLKKHKVETVKRVVVRDEAAPEKVLGGYDCSKTLEKKETK